jgi:hypothetical protein
VKEKVSERENKRENVVKCETEKGRKKTQERTVQPSFTYIYAHPRGARWDNSEDFLIR